MRTVAVCLKKQVFAILDIYRYIIEKMFHCQYGAIAKTDELDIFGVFLGVLISKLIFILQNHPKEISNLINIQIMKVSLSYATS